MSNIVYRSWYSWTKLCQLHSTSALFSEYTAICRCRYKTDAARYIQIFQNTRVAAHPVSDRCTDHSTKVTDDIWQLCWYRGSNFAIVLLSKEMWLSGLVECWCVGILSILAMFFFRSIRCDVRRGTQIGAHRTLQIEICVARARTNYVFINMSSLLAKRTRTPICSFCIRAMRRRIIRCCPCIYVVRRITYLHLSEMKLNSVLS